MRLLIIYFPLYAFHHLEPNPSWFQRSTSAIFWQCCGRCWKTRSWFMTFIWERCDLSQSSLSSHHFKMTATGRSAASAPRPHNRRHLPQCSRHCSCWYGRDGSSWKFMLAIWARDCYSEYCYLALRMRAPVTLSHNNAVELLIYGLALSGKRWRPTSNNANVITDNFLFQ